jgi:hypothetical protein
LAGEKRMKNLKIISLVAMLAVFGSVAGAAWALNNLGGQGAQSADLDTKLNLQEQIRVDTMAYIAEMHPETAAFMDDLTWTGGAVETFAPPATFIYNSQGWTVMIQEPLQEGQTYTVNAGYASLGVGIPYNLEWAGCWLNGSVTETNFSLVQ